MTWLMQVLHGANGLLAVVLGLCAFLPLLVHDRGERRAGR